MLSQHVHEGIIGTSRRHFTPGYVAHCSTTSSPPCFIHVRCIYVVYSSPSFANVDLRRFSASIDALMLALCSSSKGLPSHRRRRDPIKEHGLDTDSPAQRAPRPKSYICETCIEGFERREPLLLFMVLISLLIEATLNALQLIASLLAQHMLGHTGEKREHIFGSAVFYSWLIPLYLIQHSFAPVALNKALRASPLSISTCGRAETHPHPKCPLQPPRVGILVVPPLPAGRKARLFIQTVPGEQHY